MEKTIRYIIAGVIFSLSLAYYMTSFQLPGSDHEVRGRIAGFGNGTVFVEHEEIEGFMPAMTMPFTVEDSAEWRGLELRAPVQFTLTLRGSKSFVHSVQRLPENALPLSPAGEAGSQIFPDSNIVLVSKGDDFPDFTLINQDEKEITKNDFLGSPTVITYIYVRCPIPEFCPLLSSKFQYVQKEIKSRYPDENIQLLSITFDPKHDTPALLKTYGQRYTLDLESWQFATGETKQITNLVSAMGMVVQANGGGFIDHSLVTVVMDADGKIVRLWRGNNWQADEILWTLEPMVVPADTPPAE